MECCGRFLKPVVRLIHADTKRGGTYRQLWDKCVKCGQVYYVYSYNEPQPEDVDETVVVTYLADREQWEQFVRMALECPSPDDTSCSCIAHQQEWKGSLRELKTERATLYI